MTVDRDPIAWRLGRRAWLGAAAAVAVGALAGCAVPRPEPRPPDSPAPLPPAPPPTRPPRVGLALGGGAARGFAHIGVIQVLEREGIRPDLVVGTSAGSLVAALHAHGLGGAALEQAALEMEEATIADWTVPLFNRGLLRGEALARYVNRMVQGRTIEAMPLPLGILATELASGRPVLFRRGDTGTAVRASSAVPGVFSPVLIGGQAYVDGGLVAPVPVEQAREMGAELVIAVDISSPAEPLAQTDPVRVLLQTFTIMGQTINRHVLARADVVVRPALQGVGSADFAARQRSIAAGRSAMQAALPRLREQLVALRRSLNAATTAVR
ncbi:MAG: patatin-like phospholipase family protein [Pseudomonadota bacterium]